MGEMDRGFHSFELVALAERYQMPSELCLEIYEYLDTLFPRWADAKLVSWLKIWKSFRNHLPDEASKDDFEKFLSGKASLSLTCAGWSVILRDEFGSFDRDVLAAALLDMGHLDIESSPDKLVQLTLSEVFYLVQLAKQKQWQKQKQKSKRDERDKHLNSLVWDSNSAINAIRDARTQKDRKNIVHSHSKILSELQRLGAPVETLERVKANEEQLRKILQNYEGSNGPLTGVVGHLLSGDRSSAKSLLCDDVIGDGVDDQTVEKLLDDLLERPAWGMKLSEPEFQGWLSTLARSVDRIRRHEQQWLDAGEVWLNAADWPKSQRRRAAEFLIRTVASWLDPQAPTSVEVSETSLDRLLIAAHEILPRCNLIELSARPQAVSIGGVKVVSWTREGSMFAWVAFSEGSVAISVDLDRFTVTKLEDNAPATTAAALATAWLLDSLMRVSGTTNTLFSSSDEIWLEGPTGTEQGTGHSQALLAALDEHHVRAHLRTLPDGHNPSKEALARAPEFLRAIMGPNQTYVRAGSRHSDRFFDSVVKFTKNGSFLADVLFEGKYHT